MATFYYNLAAGVNGTGTSASPFNVWPPATITAGDSHLFKRGTSGTTAFGISSGANNSITRYGSWFNSDGSDDVAQARPIISTTSVLSAFASKKGHLRVENLDIRSVGIAVADDTSLVFLSNSATIVNTHIDTNVGGIGIWNCSNVTIQSCTVQAVTHSSANNNNVVIVEGSVAMDSVTLQNNVFLHGGGGGSNSHNGVFECSNASFGLTNLVVAGNTFTTSNSASCANLFAMAMRMTRCPSASVTGNTAKFHNVGLFGTGGGAITSLYVSSNTFLNNYHFGIDLTNNMIGCTIQYNTCSNNGTSTNNGTSLFAWGRGIELSGAAGQSTCASHTVRFNTCKGNLNYGGPSDNGSEGVGIGLDDGTVNCIVYGNDLEDNEGNGIQCYGGGNSATWTDTHNTIFANFFKNNCVASFTNRRSGGTNRNLFIGDVQLSYTYGGPTIIANNLHAGTTPVGCAAGNSNGGSITWANNVMLGLANCFMDGRSVRTATDYQSNILYQTTNFNWCLDTVDGSGIPTYPIISGFQNNTVNTITTNPLMSAGSALAWMPTQGSPAIGAGVIFTLVTTDFKNDTFRSPPTIGMYEYNGPSGVLGGRSRRSVLGRR